MSKKKNGESLETSNDEKLESGSSQPDTDPLTIIESLQERLSRWQHFTNNDKIEADKELALLKKAFE